MKQLKSVNVILNSESLNDQINEVHVSRVLSYDEKRRALVELGLTKQDLLILYNGRYFNPKAPIRVVTPRGYTFTFGVEIECFVNSNLIRQTANDNGVAIAYERYNHTDNKTHYKFVHDGSVHNEAGAGIECVSPVLKGAKGLKSLKAACKSLNDAGATVNKTCGLHVHVGAQDLNNEQIVNVYKNYQKLETLIDSFMANSRRANNNGYCQSIKGYNYSYCCSPSTLASTMRHDRYHKVNPMSYGRHKTIEFRQHQGTTNYEKISMWVNFCIKLVEWSKTNVFASEVSAISEIPFLSAKEKAYFERRKAEMSN